jgi:hypothetical protein
VGIAGCSSDDSDSGNGDHSAGGDGDDGGSGAGSGGSDGDGTEAGRSDGGSGGDGFGDVVQFESAFVMEGSFEREDGSRNEATGRIDGNDSHWTFQSDGETSEVIAVDGDSYIVSGNSCFLSSGGAPDQGITADQFEEDQTEAADVTPTGEDTIDGEAVLVYEFNSDGEEVTYYVSTETGYPVRVESKSGTFTFSSWGDVDPIEKPDMECRDPSQQG